MHLDVFEGPFDLLLGLISKHKLDITESRCPGHRRVHRLHPGPRRTAWDLDQATEFLVVAATLLDLKAARLLPAGEVEDEEDLALLEARDLLFARLLQYRAYKEVAAVLREPDGRGRAAGSRGGCRWSRASPTCCPRCCSASARPSSPRSRPGRWRPAGRRWSPPTHLHAPQVSVREQAASCPGGCAGCAGPRSGR